MMTKKAAIAAIEDIGWQESRPGLERTFELLEKFGSPQNDLKFIHVAGSNGKGSSCAMFDVILRAAGYHCGLYTSPYIQDFCERIRIDGENISGEDLGAITEKVMAAADEMIDHPTQFELITAVAMIYFKEKKTDIVVLETGMGGALDSTNVIPAPELACLTNIGLEHTEFLGDTIEAIAETKGGIIKPGCTCVCYPSDPRAVKVIRRICVEKNVAFKLAESEARQGDGSYCLAEARQKNRPLVLWRNKIYPINLLGDYQKQNAALVLTGIEALRERGWQIPEEAVRQGLETVTWPARMEVLWKRPLFILDGGHNPQCAHALRESLDGLLNALAGQKDRPKALKKMQLVDKKPLLCKGRWLAESKTEGLVFSRIVPPSVSASTDSFLRSGKPDSNPFAIFSALSTPPFVFLTGVLADKDYPAMMAEMLPIAKAFVCLTPDSPRALPAEKLAAFLRNQGAEAIACQNASEGIFKALQLAGANGAIVCFGSLYMAGGVRTVFLPVFRRFLRKRCIAARNALSPAVRCELSERAVEHLVSTNAFRAAETVMIYRAVQGELSLETLINHPSAKGKKFCYPLCQSENKMIALMPWDETGWQKGYCGIPEPILEKSEKIEPEQIDLIVCPCTGFDVKGNRMGMGGGFYDRFLKDLQHPWICAVAFEVQKIENLPVSNRDVPMDFIVTEESIYEN